MERDEKGDGKGSCLRVENNDERRREVNGRGEKKREGEKKKMGVCFLCFLGENEVGVGEKEKKRRAGMMGRELGGF